MQRSESITTSSMSTGSCSKSSQPIPTSSYCMKQLGTHEKSPSRAEGLSRWSGVPAATSIPAQQIYGQSCGQLLGRNHQAHWPTLNHCSMQSDWLTCLPCRVPLTSYLSRCSSSSPHRNLSLPQHDRPHFADQSIYGEVAHIRTLDTEVGVDGFMYCKPMLSLPGRWPLLP